MNTSSSIHSRQAHGKADYIGIAGSILCLLHCLVTPVLALGTTLASDHHTAVAGFVNLDYIFIIINGAAIYMATRDHKLSALRVFLWSSFALFAVSLLFENHNPVFEVLGYVGSGLLIAGHAFNLLYCRPWSVPSESAEAVRK